MLRLLALTFVLLQGGVSTPLPAPYVPASALDAALRDAISRVSKGAVLADITSRTVDAGHHNVDIAMVHGRGPTGAYAHDKVTELYYMLAGVGTHVSGGTLANPRRVEAQGPAVQGDAILGGTSRRVAKGDVVVVPAGTPHAWAEIVDPITYLDIRIDPDHVLPLR